MEFSTSLKENRDFHRLYQRGKSAATRNLVLYARLRGNGRNRLGITVGKKLGCAVVRNRARRRIREIYRLNESSFVRGADIVAVVRSQGAQAPYRVLERDFLALAGRLGLLL